MRRTIFFLLLLLTPPAWGATDVEDRTRTIAAELRCVVCQNLSVADSPSEMAQQMRAVIREQLEAGKSAEEIKEYFVSKYGEWVLLAPKARGFGLTLWLLPYLVLVGGLGGGVYLIRRWAGRKKPTDHSAPDWATSLAPSQDLQPRVLPRDADDDRPRGEWIHERNRLIAELEEIEFDFQSEKLSVSDYSSLRRDVESRIAGVTARLESLPETAASPPQSPRPRLPEKTENERGRLRRWQLALGGAFLLVFGLVLGVVLTNSVRPRQSERDSLTGDFLTGTGSGASETGSLMSEAKAAFAKGEWPQAIEAFKKVLAADPNQPEAHSYMGFILVQAGHADGALMAFEKALSIAPNFPMALWGKGMTLYREKQDYAAAREVLQQLIGLLPAGRDRSEIEKILAEIPPGSAGQSPAPSNATERMPASSAQVSGKVTIDASISPQLPTGAALFIIARPAGISSGPPLAVKKIDRPAFPLAYSLGPENVMMQGTPFTGKIDISARIDQDGNPATREPGNLSGSYKKNPVAVGSKDVDIVINQPAP